MDHKPSTRNGISVNHRCFNKIFAGALLVPQYPGMFELLVGSQAF